MTVIITPQYASINAAADIAEPWIQLWSGDEWGESMTSLHGACHTSYGFTDEDCALFASKLWENLLAQKNWVDTEGRTYGFWEPVQIAATQERCRELRDYWKQGGNIKQEPYISAANETLDTIPAWVFGEE